MLSIQKLSSSKAAPAYYQQADYYTKGEVGVDIKSEWLGGLAKQMGLVGEVGQVGFNSCWMERCPTKSHWDVPLASNMCMRQGGI